MTTMIELTAGRGRPRLRLVGGALAPRLMSTGPGRARVGLVATQALLLAGDDVRIDVRVGSDQHLSILEIGGTVAYPADGFRSCWTIRAVVDHGAVLTWAGQPFVVSDGANVVRDSTFELASRGVALLHETLVMGRAGERGGALLARTRINQGEMPLFAEDLDLASAAERAAPGVLGATRVLDQVMLFGARPPAEPVPGPASMTGAERFDLAGPGAILRYLGTELARSPAPQWFSAWQPGTVTKVRA